MIIVNSISGVTHQIAQENCCNLQQTDQQLEAKYRTPQLYCYTYKRIVACKRISFSTQLFLFGWGVVVIHAHVYFHFVLPLAKNNSPKGKIVANLEGQKQKYLQKI